MADSLLLFENLFEDGSTLTSSGDASGFPKENVNDWREETVYQWKSSASAASTHWVQIDYGSSTTADTFVVSGHNQTSPGATWRLKADNSDPPTTDIFTVASGSLTDPYIATFNSTSARYWRWVRDTSGSDVPQIGIITVGDRLDFESGFGVTPGLDIYGEQWVGSRAINRNGSPIGGNLRYVEKTFSINVANPGMTTTNFYDKAAPNFNATFRDHARQMKPFWYAWNTDTDSAAVYLCWADGYSQPFEFVTTRRGLNMQLRARVRV